MCPLTLYFFERSRGFPAALAWDSAKGALANPRRYPRLLAAAARWANHEPTDGVSVAEYAKRLP